MDDHVHTYFRRHSPLALRVSLNDTHYCKPLLIDYDMRVSLCPLIYLDYHKFNNKDE